MRLLTRHFRQVRRVPMCLSATWSGYRREQMRCVHREYVMVPRDNVDAIIARAAVPHRFTDGTENRYSAVVLRSAKGLEPENFGYKELIHEHFAGLLHVPIGALNR